MFRPLPGTAVEVDDPQEVLQLFGVGGARVLLDGVFPVRVGGDSTGGHLVAQDVNGVLLKLALLRIRCESCLLEACKHLHRGGRAGRIAISNR